MVVVVSPDVVPSDALLQAVTAPAIANTANNFFIAVDFVLLMGAKVVAGSKIQKHPPAFQQ
jgi:hypothetical protein